MILDIERITGYLFVSGHQTDHRLDRVDKRDCSYMDRIVMRLVSL